MHSIWSTALISGTTTTIQQEAISHYKTWHRTVFGREQLTKKTTLNLAANVDRMFFFLRRLQSLIQSITNSIKQHSRRLSATSRSVVAYAFADRRLECTLRKTRRKEATDDKCSVSQSRSVHWLLAKADYRSAPIADLRKKGVDSELVRRRTEIRSTRTIFHLLRSTRCCTTRAEAKENRTELRAQCSATSPWV